MGSISTAAAVVKHTAVPFEPTPYKIYSPPPSPQHLIQTLSHSLTGAWRVCDVSVLIRLLCANGNLLSLCSTAVLYSSRYEDNQAADHLT